MIQTSHRQNKETFNLFRKALYKCDVTALQGQLNHVFAANAVIHLAFPFEDLDGPNALVDQAYRPLINAIPDLERRDYIVMAGESNNENWVGVPAFIQVSSSNHGFIYRRLNTQFLCAIMNFFGWKRVAMDRAKLLRYRHSGIFPRS